MKYKWECKFCLQKSGNFKNYDRMMDASRVHQKYYCNLLRMLYGQKALGWFKNER